MNDAASRRQGLRLLLIALLLLVRLVALNADPPGWLSWSTGIGTDEGFYTLDARHEVLFGHWAPGNFHDRLLSPLLSLLQQGVFALAGPRLLTARLLCVLFGLLTLWVFWKGLRTACGSTVADAGALFLGFAPPFIFYNRLALQETPTVFWLALAFLLWAEGEARKETRRRGLWLFFAGTAFGIGVVFKPLALLALPAFLWLWRRPSLLLSTAGLGSVLILYGALWYAPHHAELQRMATFYRVHQMQPQTGLEVWLNIRRGLIGGERGVFPYLLALMPVPLLLTVWGLHRRTPWTAFFGLWLMAGLAFCLTSSYAPSRYHVLFLPALAGLAALGWEALRPQSKTTAALLFMLTSGLWCGQAWTQRTYERQHAAQALTHLLPPGSVIIGDFAPALCLDTPFAAAPVQPGLSNDQNPVLRLHAAAVTVTEVPFWQHWWQTHDPQLLQSSHSLAAFTLGGSRRWVVKVYSASRSASQPAFSHHSFSHR